VSSITSTVPNGALCVASTTEADVPLPSSSDGPTSENNGASTSGPKTVLCLIHAHRTIVFVELHHSQAKLPHLSEDKPLPLATHEEADNGQRADERLDPASLHMNTTQLASPGESTAEEDQHVARILAEHGNEDM
jgi:hypothetical protein